MVRTLIEALIAILFFGCIPVVVKSISANPYTIGIVRFGVATLVLGAVMAVRGEIKRIAPRDVLRLAVIGALFFGHWLTLFIAVKASSASIAAIGLWTYISDCDLCVLCASVVKTKRDESQQRHRG